MVSIAERALGWVRVNEDALTHFMIWLAWLMTGAIFYTVHDFDGNFCKGFYYAVNVGYSIGFGVLHLNGSHNWNLASYGFSIVYVLSGSLAIIISLSHVVASLEAAAAKRQESHWYAASRLFSRRSGRDVDWTTRWRYYFLGRLDLFLRIIIWLIFILFGSIWATLIFKWDYVEGLYFAVSSLSTGGLYGIPADADDLCFLFVGLYCCTGIPYMAMAMSAIAELIMEEFKRRKWDRSLLEGDDEDEDEEEGKGDGKDTRRVEDATSSPPPPQSRLELSLVEPSNNNYDSSDALPKRLLFGGGEAPPTPPSTSVKQKQRQSVYRKKELVMFDHLFQQRQQQDTYREMDIYSYVLLNLIRKGAVDKGELERAMCTFDAIYASQRRRDSDVSFSEAMGVTSDTDNDSLTSKARSSTFTSRGTRVISIALLEEDS